MIPKILNSIIKIKRGLKANLANSGTNEGELKYATDTNELFIYSDGENKLLNGGGGDIWDLIANISEGGIENTKNNFVINWGHGSILGGEFKYFRFKKEMKKLGIVYIHQDLKAVISDITRFVEIDVISTLGMTVRNYDPKTDRNTPFKYLVIGYNN